MSFEVVKHKVKKAIRKLRNQDSFLIDADTNERTISHKLAEYLQEEFPKLNVDCEYNRHGTDIKKLNTIIITNKVGLYDIEAKTIFPDIIIHERNTDNRNLLVIEVKKSSNRRGHQLDKTKLGLLTKDDYRYHFGLFLELSMSDTNDVLEWYANGWVLYEQNNKSEAD